MWPELLTFKEVTWLQQPGGPSFGNVLYWKYVPARYTPLECPLIRWLDTFIDCRPATPSVMASQVSATMSGSVGKSGMKDIVFSFGLRYCDFQLRYPTPINSLWPSGAIWRQRSGSTLVQVMACCLTAPSHYLNQCWLIISEVSWHSY